MKRMKMKRNAPGETKRGGMVSRRRLPTPPGRTRSRAPVAVANSRGSRANRAAMTFPAAASAWRARGRRPGSAWAPVPFSTIERIFGTLTTIKKLQRRRAACSTGPFP